MLRHADLSSDTQSYGCSAGLEVSCPISLRLSWVGVNRDMTNCVSDYDKSACTCNIKI